MEEIKNPVGRPAWTPTKKEIDDAEAYASRGLTKEQIAECLGIHYDTLNEKSKLYPEFSDAIKRGKAKGIAHVASNLMKNIENGSVPAQIFWLKVNAKWKETEVVESVNIPHEKALDDLA
jgi:DNA-binding XRE family transcriptional regulator